MAGVEPAHLVEVHAAPGKAQGGKEDPGGVGVGKDQPRRPQQPHVPGVEHQKQVLAVFHVAAVPQLRQVLVVEGIPPAQAFHRLGEGQGLVALQHHRPQP